MPPESLVRSRLRAFVTMAILGVAILVTTIVGALLAAITILPGLVKPLSFLVTIALNTGVILLVFRYLDPHRRTWRAPPWRDRRCRRVDDPPDRRRAFRALRRRVRPMCGTFAVVIGLLTWINIQVRLILWAAELNTVIEARAAGELPQPERAKPGEPAPAQ